MSPSYNVEAEFLSKIQNEVEETPKKPRGTNTTPKNKKRSKNNRKN